MKLTTHAFAAHSVMSKQALDSEQVRSGLKDVLLGPAQLYEALRVRGDSASGQISATGGLHRLRLREGRHCCNGALFSVSAP
jgi:hypothetical protein